MPKANAIAGTKWALSWIVGLIALLAMALFYFDFNNRGYLSIATPGDSSVKAEVVTSLTDVQRGLGGRKSIASDRGMLFVYTNDRELCFWMKDMLINIDIIWLDQSKKVVYIVPNLSPSSYPQSYCPKMPARYVLEVGAGRAQELGIAVGQSMEW
jgi:uncharacterized protein